jgi:hypothetical protein
MERERRDEIAILRVKLNAEAVVRTMVEKLVSLDVLEKEIAEAIELISHEAETKAIFELSKKPPPQELIKSVRSIRDRVSLSIYPLILVA